jgi:NADH-quinone oxidoreductase subunit L
MTQVPKELENVWLVPALPLAAAIATPLLRRFLRQRAHLPTLIGAAGAFLFALITYLAAVFEVKDWSSPARVTVLADWISFGDFRTGLTLQVDPLACLMLLTVTGVGLMVVCFSVGYMRGDPNYARFFSFVSLFLFAMCVLVLADNFLLLYLGWEGVGLCSYLLIGFWHHKPAAAAAAKKAFLVNRIGDFGFGIGILLIWTYFGSLNYGDVFAIAADKGLWPAEAHGGREIGYGVLAAIALLLFVGACGKSAQLPLYVWLPDAMEGPTPVSALIHAATMVTAGVYMVARCTPLFFPGGDGAWPAGWAVAPPDVVAVVGGVTAFFAAVIALGQYDMKRILAYSTISQLGYMFLALGVGATGAAIFHLHTHAFFKAALFLSAGAVMHATGGELDLRKIGGLRRVLPSVYWVMLIGSPALTGFPFTAGFFSKDAILHEAFNVHSALGVLGLATAVLTAFYTFRLFFRGFFGRLRLPGQVRGHVHAPDAWMTAPLFVLAGMSILSGLYGIGAHVGLFGGFLDKTPYVDAAVGALARHDPATGMSAGTAMALSTLAVVVGIHAAYRVFVGMDAPMWPEEPVAVRDALEGKFWVDELYYYALVRPLEKLADAFRAFDKVVVDGVVFIVGFIPQLLGRLLRLFQSGYVQSYGLYMLAALAVIGLAVLRSLS